MSSLFLASIFSSFSAERNIKLSMSILQVPCYNPKIKTETPNQFANTCWRGERTLRLARELAGGLVDESALMLDIKRLRSAGVAKVTTCSWCSLEPSQEIEKRPVPVHVQCANAVLMMGVGAATSGFITGDNNEISGVHFPSQLALA
jgi:hypothetical protein